MKVNHKLQLIAVFMGMLMLNACGGGNDSTPVTQPATTPVTPPATTPATPPATPPATTPPPVSQSLEGSWMTTCSASNNLAGYDEQDTFNFKGNKRTITKFFYQQNTNCKHSDKVLRARITAGIALGAAVNPGTDTGHTKIDITPTKVNLAPMNSTLTALLKNTSHTSNESIYNGYGKNNWYRNQWRDISSIDAAKTNFKINQVIPDIFQISKKMVDGTTHKVLKLGAQGDNVDSDGRPLALAGSITVIKQQKTTPTQTAQAARLIGQWKYSCRYSKGRDTLVQSSTLTFTDNKLKALITFYGSLDTNSGCNQHPVFQVEIEADIVVGKVINKGAATEHTQIGIKTTKVKMQITTGIYADNYAASFNRSHLHNASVKNLYNGYGQRDWKVDDWKNISTIPDAIETLDIGTQVPDIFKISTATDGSKELKMGDYQGSFDINGRAMSLEAKGAVLQ